MRHLINLEQGRLTRVQIMDNLFLRTELTILYTPKLASNLCKRSCIYNVVSVNLSKSRVNSCLWIYTVF